jgi:uncharacterized membrane protein
MNRFRGHLESILAAVCFGCAPIFAKKGFSSGLNPFYGATIAIATALVAFSFFSIKSGGKKAIIMRRQGLVFALLGGIANTVAALFYFWAISIGKVSVVVPITSIYPLFTILVAYFFFKESEAADILTIIGTLLIIIGIIFMI